MVRIEIDLSDNIIDILGKEANRMGVTQSELIRYLLGSYSAQSMFASRPDVIASFRRASDELKNTTKSMMKNVAAAGGFKCRHCTQPIGPEDIDAGECPSCHSIIAY